MINQKILKVTAFAEGSLQGNPAGVMILPANEPWPPDEALQAVAIDVGFSETSFVRSHADGKFDLRWFTPAFEVDLCGHATLAAAFTLWESIVDKTPITFTTRSGELKITRNGSTGRISLDFPSDSPVRDAKCLALRELLAEALRIESGVINDCYCGRYHVAVVVVADERSVFRCKPDFAAIEKLEARAVLLTARSAAGSVADFTSRFFAPKCGVPEDPVTGSAHCLLGPYWAEQLGKEALIGYQASDRGGLVYVDVTPGADRILISGAARFMNALGRS